MASCIIQVTDRLIEQHLVAFVKSAAVLGVPGSGKERAYNVAKIMGFTGEHFVEHLGEIAAIKEKTIATAAD